jgi:hypothetical protein
VNLLFDKAYPVLIEAAIAAPTAVVGNDTFFPKFVLSDSGILYENPVMQIGVKCEFHSRIGALCQSC